MFFGRVNSFELALFIFYATCFCRCGRASWRIMLNENRLSKNILIS